MEQAGNVATPDKSQSLVSVIIPCFNAAPHLRASIESVLGQTHRNVEVIVVDDASSDTSVEVISRLSALDSRVRALHMSKRSGVAAARNRGLDAANGRFVAFLDADDSWLPSKLERQLTFLRERGAGLVYTAVEVRNEDGVLLGHRAVSESVTADGLLVHNEIAASSVLVDLHVAGSFRMPLLTRRQDLATWYALLKRGVSARGLNEVLTRYTKRKGSLSSNKIHAALANWDLYRKHLKLDLLTATRLFIGYAAAALRRV